MLTKHPPNSRSAIWALLLLAALWGYNWVQMKIAVQYASPFQFSAWRVALGGLTLLLAMVWLRKPLKPKAIPETCLIGLLQTAGVYGLASWALVSGGAGKTSVLVYTMPFWTILFAWFGLGERVRGLQWWVIGLGLAGLVLILEPQQMGGTVGSKLLAVLAGMSWAGGAVVTKRLRQRTEVDLFSLTTWQTIFAAVPLIAVVLLTPAEPIDWSTPFLIALVYNVIPGTAVAALLWMFVLDRLSAGTAGLGVLLNPTVGVLAAWIQLGERPSAIETMGMIVLALALILNAIQAMRSAQPS
ncbi:EamA family transporter [Leptolyngbya sp. NK1-12]|uniref:EamA family transporter n=2 Tax=Leptolyngbya sp. NK1-12 TaxID=2547451 RepID=A0AA96WLH3_9CYAN|nr:EamA family transporter [Leptolyngbya sp. NK1-12]